MLLKIKVVLTVFFMSLAIIAAGAPEFDFHFDKGKSADGIAFSGGSRLNKNGVIHIPAGGRITLPALSKWNLSPQGCTFVVTLKTGDPENIALFGKEGSFESRAAANLETTVFAVQKQNSRTVPWHCPLPAGEFVQIALTLRHTKYTPSGEIGYMVTSFVNEELVAQTLLQNMEPAASNNALYIGGKNFSGEIVKIDFFDKALSDGRVLELARDNPWIRPVIDIPRSLQEKLKISAGDSALKKWLKRALLRSLNEGAAVEKVSAMADAISGKTNINAAQSGYSFFRSSKSAWLIARKGTTEPVIAGMFDPRTGKDVSGKRMIKWQLYTASGIISDTTDGVVFETSDFKKVDDSVEFDIIWKYKKIRVISHVVLRGARLEADLKVENNDPQLIINEVVYPFFNINPPAADKAKNREVLPDYSGRDFPCILNGSFASGFYYPSMISMQFAAIYDEVTRNGIYFAFEESKPVCKLTGRGGISGEYCYEYRTAVPYTAKNQGGNSYRSHGPAVIELYQGRWFEAGQVYKRFLREKSEWFVHDLPRKDTPEWYRNNPFWIVQGDLEELLYLRKYLEVPFGLDATGWWYEMGKANTEDAPRMVKMINCGDRRLLGPERAAAQLKKLQAAGIRVRPYLNFRLWAYCQYFYTGKKIAPDRSEKGKKLAIKNYDGTIHEEPYGAFKFLVVCPYNQEWQDILYDNLKFIASCGFDGVYLDQTVDCRFMLCHDPTHGHDMRSPYIWHESYFKLLDKVRSELRKEYPNFTMDGEGTTEVWMSHMDGFQGWQMQFAGSNVPLQQSIYGGGRVQFVGRGTECYGGVGSWNAFFCRMASQLVYSEQIGWLHMNDFRFGAGRRKFTKKICQLRWNLNDYFNRSDMLAPLEFAQPMPTHVNAWGCVLTTYHQTDKIMHAVWQRTDGKIMIPFVNTTNETVSVKPILPWQGKLAVCSEGTGKVAVYRTDNAPVLKLGPHETQVWFIDRQGDVDPIAKKLAAVMKRFPGFDDGEVLSYVQDYSREAKVKVEKNKWINSREVSWTVLAFREHEVTVNYVRNGSPENTSGWIIGKSGGVAYFGEFDFGDARPRSIEIEVSIAEEKVDGKLRLMDLSGSGFPEKALAEVKIPDTPKPFDFKVVRVPLDPTVYGKRRIAWCFEKPAIIRRWRIVE